MKKQAKIILCGSIAIDRIMNFASKYTDHLDLNKTDNFSLSVFLTGLKNSYSGIAANIAYTLALLGDKPVLLGAVGQEAVQFITKLKSLGIDISHVHLSKLPTASFNVITDGANNQIGGFYPGAMFDSENLTLKKWKKDNVFVVMSAHDPKAMRRQIEECSLYKLPMCYDIGQQVINTSIEDLSLGVSMAEILILNDFELSILSQKIKTSPEILKSKTPIIITTMGEKGSMIEGKKVRGKIAIKAVKSKVVVDPTGAGDAFRGGFFYGFARGWELEKCGQLGAVAASYAIENSGTQEHNFTKQEFIERFESSFREKLLLI